MMPQEIGLLVVFLLVFLYDTFMPQSSQRSLPAFTAVVFGIFTIFSFIPASTGTAFAGMFEQSQATWAMKAILNIGAFLVILQAMKWSNSDFIAVRRGEFYELTLLTLSIAALAAFEKRYYESHEAAAKYIFTAIFSSAILLLGISFVYGMTGSLMYSQVAQSFILGKAAHSALLITALAFVIAGVGFKISLVPFHLWTADVYEGAPTAVTSYLSVVSKGAAAFAFLIILVQAFGAVYADVWKWMLYAVIVLTITIGNLFAVRQRNIKRFLAFSSISQAGYIVLGVIAANTLGMASMMYYVLVYILSNLAAFGVASVIERNTGKLTIDDYNGLFNTNPWLSFTMMLAMFSLGGIPPFAGFFSKFFVFAGTLHNATDYSLYILVLIALINTIISLYYYLLVVKAMFIRQDECVIPRVKSAWNEKLMLIICGLGIVLVGLASCIYTSLTSITEASGTIFSLI